MPVRPRPASPRLFGPQLLAAVRSRLARGYPTSPHSHGVRFELAKRDVNALLGELELRDREVISLHARIYELTPKPPA